MNNDKSGQKIRKPIIGIQMLRGIAALMVVFHHLIAPIPGMFNPVKDVNFGTAGVDIFFVISGFIMYVAARDEKPSTFIARRIVRIVPLYWISTIGFVIIAYFTIQQQLSGIGIQHIAKSLFFIPFENPTHSGEIWPVLVPGWTLNFEMFFYFLFFVSLFFQRKLIILTTCILLATLSRIFSDEPSAPLQIYTSLLLLEFLAGVFLGKLYEKANLLPLWPLLFAGFIGIVFADMYLPGDLKALVTGISAVAIVSGTLAIEDHLPFKSGPLLSLGNASYSIYLSHVIVLIFFFAVWKRLPLEGWPQFLSLVVVGLTACSLVGYAVFVFVERPIYKLCLAHMARQRQ